MAEGRAGDCGTEEYPLHKRLKWRNLRYVFNNTSQEYENLLCEPPQTPPIHRLSRDINLLATSARQRFPLDTTGVLTLRWHQRDSRQDESSRRRFGPRDSTSVLRASACASCWFHSFATRMDAPGDTHSGRFVQITQRNVSEWFNPLIFHASTCAT